MMRCGTIREDLSAYLDGEVSASTRVAIERHIAGCAECARYKGELEKAIESLRSVGRLEPSASFHADTMRRIRTTSKVPVARPVLVRRRAIAFASLAIAVLMVVGWLWLFGYRPPDSDLVLTDAVVEALLEVERGMMSPDAESDLGYAGPVSEELPLVLATAYYSDNVPVEEMIEMLPESDRTEFRTALLDLVQEG